MTSYFLQREQWIPRTAEEVFSFFAHAGNLEAVTPSWLGFRILSPVPVVLRSGTRIRYRLRWHGLPLDWLTEIQSWNPPAEFVDVQIRGPYRLWQHTHRFEPAGAGTWMRDVVRYALPCGPVGRLAHALLVRSDLEAIFDFRAVMVSRLLGGGRVVRKEGAK